MDIYRNQERELKLAKKPLIVWKMNYGKSINSIDCEKISEIVRRDWRKLSQLRDQPCKQYKKRSQERQTNKMTKPISTINGLKRNDINDLHLRFIQLVMEMKKEGHDPLAIAGCMLAGAVQMYQSELGMQTTSDLLDQIANGSDDDIDIDLDVDKETIH